MSRSPDDIEASLQIPADIADPAIARVAELDAQRGDWPNPRDAHVPDPPWPTEDAPMVHFLLHKAQASIDAGMEPAIAMLQLAVHAWFEGGVEGYDRGQRDARRPRAVE